MSVAGKMRRPAAGNTKRHLMLSPHKCWSEALMKSGHWRCEKVWITYARGVRGLSTIDKRGLHYHPPDLGKR